MRYAEKIACTCINCGRVFASVRMTRLHEMGCREDDVSLDGDRVRDGHGPGGRERKRESERERHYRRQRRDYTMRGDAQPGAGWADSQFNTSLERRGAFSFSTSPSPAKMGHSYQKTDIRAYAHEAEGARQRSLRSQHGAQWDGRRGRGEEQFWGSATDGPVDRGGAEEWGKRLGAAETYGHDKSPRQVGASFPITASALVCWLQRTLHPSTSPSPTFFSCSPPSPLPKLTCSLSSS